MTIDDPYLVRILKKHYKETEQEEKPLYKEIKGLYFFAKTIDKIGNYAIEPLFNDAGDFFQVLQDCNTRHLDNFPPLAQVEIDGKVSYINKKGDIINPDDTQSSDKRK